MKSQAHVSRKPADLQLTRRETVALLFVLASAAFYWTWFGRFTGILLEDALITFRYAENLASGAGFSFNPGENVLGTTTPLFTLLLSGFGLLVGVKHIPTIADAMLVVGGVVALLCLYRAGRISGIRAAPALLAIGWVAFHPDVVWTTAGGMETSLVLAGMASSLMTAVSRHWRATGVLLGLLVLLRIDTIVWAAGLVIVLSWREWRALRQTLVFGSLVLIPWAIYGFLEFGSPIPHSVIAKRAVTSVAGNEPGMAAFLSWFLEGLGTRVRGGAWEAIVLGSLFALLVYGAIAALDKSKARFLLPLLVLIPGLGLAYFFGRAPREFEWYLVPVTFCALPVAATGAFQLRRILRHWAADSNVPSWTGSLVMALFIASPTLNLIQGNKNAVVYHQRYQQNEDGLRRRVGEWLAEHTPPDATIAMEAIGYQGTTCQRRVIDLAGLISPEVVRIHRQSSSLAEALARVLDELKPDYVVLRSFEVDDNMSFFGGVLIEDDRQASLWQRYLEVKRFSAPVPELWGRLAHLTVFERVEGPGNAQ